MNIRKFFFFMFDKRNMVRNQLLEIEKANTDDSFAKILHEKSIDQLMSHIKKTVPFYKEIQSDRFEDFPIVNKIMMKENMQAFRSETNLRIGKIRHTSGSTGIPFEIIQDERKSKRIQAEVIYYRNLTGDELGTKFINLISPSRMEKTNFLSEFKQNVIAFDVTNMDDVMIELLRKKLLHNNIYYMLGYASALERIATYLGEKNYNDKYPLKAIVSSSEVMTDATITKLNHLFGCPVYDRYSNEDNGFIAQTDGFSHDFIVNRASYYIEILKLDSDNPAEENEIGRIIITDYFNFAQPFFRYDTGDLGSFSYKNINGSKHYILTKIAGRVSDIVYDMCDKPISTFAIGCALEVFSEIKQYQLIQNSKEDFVLNIIDPKKLYKKDDYKKALVEVLGDGINLSITYLDKLPVLRSGKYKRVICNYKPESISY